MVGTGETECVDRAVGALREHDPSEWRKRNKDEVAREAREERKRGVG